MKLKDTIRQNNTNLDEIETYYWTRVYTIMRIYKNW